MTTNLFPDIARRWIARLRGEPPKSETEKSLDRAAASGDHQPPSEDTEPPSGQDKLKRAAKKNDPEHSGARSNEP